ncbi:MAG: SurA N-terminal domain-containing protein [Deltaproteobacteria bacterium]|nr:SurA N-terminal domain-containing protein [Deltaproteobacteria bacterium]
MLELMRKKSRSSLMLFAIAAISIVFVFSYINMGGNSQVTEQVVATVDGDSITVQQYNNMYQQQVNYYQKVLKENFSDEMMKRLKVREQALDTLVDNVLMTRAARKSRVRVSDKEVQDRILADPLFQKDGVFSEEVYYSMLDSNRVKAEDYEESVKSDIKVDKLRRGILEAVVVDDQELRREYLRNSSEISIHFVELSSESYASDIIINEEDARKYLDEHKEDYMVPLKVRAAYAYLSNDDVLKSVTVTDEEIKDYYDKNISSYYVKKEVKARHILIRPEVGAEDSVKADEEAKAKAEEIHKKIIKGGDFTKQVMEHSEDRTSIDEGGSLGWFGEGAMVQPFEDAAFSTGKGETSEVVKTSYGYHIIRVDDARGGSATPFSEVKKEISDHLTGLRAEREGRDRVAALHDELKSLGVDDASLTEAKTKIEEGGVSFNITSLFGEDDKDVALNSNLSLKKSVFQLAAGDASGVIETEDGFYVIKVIERVEEHVTPFAEVSHKVEKALLTEKASVIAGEKAGSLLEKILGGSDYRDVAKENDLEVRDTTFFTLPQKYIPEFGAYTGNIPDLFDITPDKPVYSFVIPHLERFYIVKLKERRDADLEVFEANKENIRAELLTERRNQREKEWMDGLREKADITYNPDYL